MVARREARGTTKPAGSPRQLARRDYPEMDVHAMPGSPEHRDFMKLIFEIIRLFYKLDPNVYVGSDMMVYYEPHNRRRFVAPDVFVALQKPAQPELGRYLLWEDGPIHWVLEVLSESTRREDVTFKRRLYAQLGVWEYFTFNPEPTALYPALQGWRLVEGEYAPIPPDGWGRLAMDVLGLDIAVEDGVPCIYRQDTGTRLLTPEEAERARAEAAEQRAEAERVRAEALAAQLAELQRRLDERA